MSLLMDAIRDARRRLVLSAAESRGAAIELERECGRPIVMSDWLRFRAAWLDLFAAMLGQG